MFCMLSLIFTAGFSPWHINPDRILFFFFASEALLPPPPSVIVRLLSEWLLTVKTNWGGGSHREVGGGETGSDFSGWVVKPVYRWSKCIFLTAINASSPNLFTVVFIAGSSLYKRNPPQGNILLQVCKCIGVSNLSLSPHIWVTKKKTQKKNRTFVLSLFLCSLQ